MSTRAQVLIEDEGIYLYQHSDGYEIGEIVAKSIASPRAQSRGTNPEYLARIIFEDMIVNAGPHGLGQETGFGIGSSQHGDIEWLVTVNCAKQTYTVTQLYANTSEAFGFDGQPV